MFMLTYKTTLEYKFSESGPMLLLLHLPVIQMYHINNE